MVGAGEHKLSAVLIAVIDLFFFGLGFARVLQLAHARSWGLDLRKRVEADQARYAEVLGAMVSGGSCLCCRQRISAEIRPGSATCYGCGKPE